MTKSAKQCVLEILVNKESCTLKDIQCVYTQLRKDKRVSKTMKTLILNELRIIYHEKKVTNVAGCI